MNGMFNLALKAFASNSKYLIKDGKYLIEAPPKRPSTSFFLYSNEAREKMPKSTPEQKVSVVEQSKAIAEQWKALAPEEKEKYEKKYKEARAKYDEELAKYKAKFDEPYHKVNHLTLLRK